MSEPARSSSPLVTRASAPSPGRLTAMAMIGMAAGAVPLPFVPAVVLRRIRGALAHDVVARHGLCLTEDARKEISKPSRAAQGGAVLSTVVFLARRTLRRLGAIGVLPPLASWLEIYALGLLLDRYLERVRSSPTLRIHRREAELVRKAIDEAVSRALSPKLELKPRQGESGPTEELRSVSTRLFDGVLLAIAAVPDHLQRRLETAFDRVMDEEPLHDV